jgi:hypothetical protein
LCTADFGKEKMITLKGMLSAVSKLNSGLMSVAGLDDKAIEQQVTELVRSTI